MAGAFDDMILGEMLMKVGLDLSSIKVSLTKAERDILPQVTLLSRRIGEAFAKGDVHGAFAISESLTKRQKDLLGRLTGEFHKLGVTSDQVYNLIGAGAVRATKAIEMNAAAIRKAQLDIEKAAAKRFNAFGKEQLGKEVAANVPNIAAAKAETAALLEKTRREAEIHKQAYAQRKADIIEAFKADDDAKKRALAIDKAHTLALAENRKRDMQSMRSALAEESQMRRAHEMMRADFARREKQQLAEQRAGLESTRRVMYDLRNVGLAMTAAVTVPVLGISAAAIKVSGDFRIAENSIRKMMGAVDIGNTMMERLTQFAIKSPLDFKETIQGARRLVVMKAAGEDLIKTLQILTDTVASTGGDEGTFKRLIKAFTDVKQKGYLASQEIIQFGNANVNAVELISQGMGKTVPEVLELIHDKAIDANTAIRLIKEGLDKNFGGEGISRLAEVPGKIQQMKDEWTLALKAMGDALEPLTKKMLDVGIGAAQMGKNLMESLKEAPESVKLLAAGLVGVAAAAGPAATLLSQVGLAAIGVKEIVLLLRSNVTLLGTSLTGLATAGWAGLAVGIGAAAAAAIYHLSTVNSKLDDTFGKLERWEKHREGGGDAKSFAEAEATRDRMAFGAKWDPTWAKNNVPGSDFKVSVLQPEPPKKGKKAKPVTEYNWKGARMYESAEKRSADEIAMQDFKRKKAEYHRETLEATENVAKVDELLHGLSMIEAGAAGYANEAALAYAASANGLADMQNQEYLMIGNRKHWLTQGAEVINQLNDLSEAMIAPTRANRDLGESMQVLGIEDVEAKLQLVVAAHADIRRAYEEGKVTAQTYYQAELALLKARLNAGQKLNAQEEEYFRKLEKQTNGVGNLKKAWTGFMRQVSTIMTDASRAIVNILFPDDMVGKTEKFSSNITSAFREAFEGLSGQGYDNPAKALEQVIEMIKRAGSVSEANAIAVRHFGQTGPEIARLLRSGAIGAKELAELMGLAKDSLTDLTKETEDKGSKIARIWHEIWTSTFRAGIESAGEALMTFIGKHLKNLINSMDDILMRIPKIGKGLADIFGNTSSTIGGIATGAGNTAGSVIMEGPMQIPGGLGGIPGVGSTGGGAGKAAGSAAGMGVSGAINLVTGAVSAIAGVISAIGTVRLEGTMNAVEWNTRKGSIHAEHILGKLNEFLPFQSMIHQRLVELQPLLAGGSVGPTGGTHITNVYVDGVLLNSSGSAGELFSQGVEDLRRRGLIAVRGQR
jgi:hypothetical protein